MKRILFVHHGKGIGGAPLTLLSIIRLLDRKAFNPTVLCLFESEAAEMFRKEGVETHIGRGIYHLPHTTGVWYPLHYLPMLLVKLLLFPWSIWQSFRFLKKGQFDLVHLNSSSLLAVAVAARLQKIPALTHILEHLHPGYFGVRRFLLARLLTLFSDALVFICYEDAKPFPRSHKVHVIYDGIDPDQFNPAKVVESVRPSFNIPQKGQLVGMFGGIHPIKGTLEFVKAAALVVRQLPDSHFLILGVEPEAERETILLSILQVVKKRLSPLRRYRREVFELANKDALKERVHFMRPLLDVPPIVKSLDVMVFPSRSPHYARPLIEAAFMKKPVIASRIGGPEEIVVDGVTGLLVPPGDFRELAQRIVELLGDESKRLRMGEAGSQRAVEMFDMKKNVPEILKLHEQLVQNADI